MWNVPKIRFVTIVTVKRVEKGVKDFVLGEEFKHGYTIGGSDLPAIFSRLHDPRSPACEAFAADDVLPD